MGNIITTAQGDLVTQNGISEIKDTSFAKIINDTLLELDLYTATDKKNPEINYSSSSVLNKRPKMSNNDPRLKDINGLPYTTNEDISQVLSNPGPNDLNTEYVLGMDSSTPFTNKNYNMKRGFCSGTTTVPVNIVGVDLPTDQYYDNVGKQYYNTIKGNTPIDPSNPNSQTFYAAKQASKGILTMKELDNCIQYGEIAGIAAEPGTYVINTVPSYFYNSIINIDKIGTLQNRNALLYVDRTKPVYVQPINGVPVGIVSGVDQCLITIQYFDPTMTLPAINDSNCIGYYAEANPTYQSLTNIDEKKNSQVVLFPLNITALGQTKRSKQTGSSINTIDALIFYLNEKKLISTSITDILAVNGSSVIINTVPTKIIVSDSNNKPIINNEYPLNTRTSGTFPETLNYAIFFKSKKVFSKSPMISDIDLSPTTNETLNDYSTKSIYGATLSTECQVKLNALLTNSYINTNIPKYTKLNNIYGGNNDIDNKGTNTPYSDGNSKYYNYIEDPNDPSRFAIKASAPKDGNSYKIFGAPYSQDDKGKSVMTGVTPDCNPFYQDLCDYYYKYDVVDGILFNNTFNTQINTNQNISSYLQNLRFITDHIPDCRCVNSKPVQDGLFKSDDYYDKLSCEYDSRLYGTSDPTDAYNSSISEGSLYGGDNTMAQPIKLYNINTEKLNSYKDSQGKQINISDQEYGFRRQVDPAYSSSHNAPIEMNDNRFLYAENNRSKSVTYNSYTCNQSYSPIISGVGGNVLTSGISLSCNFPGAPTNETSTDTTLKSITGSFYNTILNQFITLDGTYTLPIATNTNIELNVDFPDSTYPGVFLPNYRFILINTIDNTQQILKNSCGSSDEKNSCTGPYSINVPFIYAPISNNSGVEYIITLENITPAPTNGKPLIISPSIACHLVIKHYSMKITKIKILAANGKKYVQFNIDLNTSDIVNNVPYRIIFTPIDSTKLNTITMYGQDFFNDVFNVNGLLFAHYDSTQPFLDIEYSYKIMINEKKSFVNNRVIYSGGNQLLYDDILMNTSDKDTIDFSKVKSGFNQFSLSYYDYDNNHVSNLIGNNDTIKTAVTVVVSWNFFSTDTAYTNMNIYYKLNDENSLEYKINSSPVSVSAESYTFIFPVFPTPKIINIYACIIDSITGNNILDVTGKPLLQSPVFTVKSKDIGETFRSWLVISNKTFNPNDKKLIVLNSNPSNPSNTSILDYLTFSAINNYRNILFDYTVNQWFYSTSELESLSISSASGSASDSALLSGLTTLAPPTNFVILQALPAPPAITFTIEDITYLDSTGTEKSLYDEINPPTEIQMGSSLNIKWKFTPASATNIKIQVKMFNQINSSFTLLKNTSSGTHPIMLYDNTGNLNVQQTDIELISYETLIKTLPKTISNITTNNISRPVLIENGSANANISTPYVFLLSTNPSSLISSINLTINEPLDNKYYIYYQNILDNTSISTYNIIFKDIDVTKDISFIHSSQQSQEFSNVKFGLRKKYKEHFESPIFPKRKTKEYLDSTLDPLSDPVLGGSNNINKQLHIDKLIFDFSNIGVNVNKYLSMISTYNGYYSINISTLIINMGSTNLDNYKFNIDFNGVFTTTPTQIQITNINVIGKLTTQIMFIKNIAGLENVRYYDQSGNFTKLIYSNGYYALPENFSVEPKSVSQESKDNSWIYWIIGGIGFIGLLVLVYFLFFRKKK